MSKIIDTTGKGAAISQVENDSNLSTLAGINVVDATTSRTIDIDDQGATIEFTSGSPIAVTLDDIATITAALHTDDFTVKIIAIGAGSVTITPDATDAFNTGVSTIVLATDEYVVLQTDSTGAIWNIIGYSNAMKLGGLAASQFLRSDANDSASGDLTFSGAIDVSGSLDITGTFDIGGVQVNSTANELNVLDGVGGGTWTPVLYGLTTAGTVTYSSRVANYYKIGKLMFVDCDIITSSLGGAVGQLAISGLPENAAANIPVSINSYRGITTGLTDANPDAIIGSGTKIMTLQLSYEGAGSNASLTAAMLAANSRIRFSFCYEWV